MRSGDAELIRRRLPAGAAAASATGARRLRPRMRGPARLGAVSGHRVFREREPLREMITPEGQAQSDPDRIDERSRTLAQRDMGLGIVAPPYGNLRHRDPEALRDRQRLDVESEAVHPGTPED